MFILKIKYKFTEILNLILGVYCIKKTSRCFLFSSSFLFIIILN